MPAHKTGGLYKTIRAEAFCRGLSSRAFRDGEGTFRFKPSGHRSVDFMQHPRPSRPRRQMQDGIEETEKPAVHVPVASPSSPITDQ